MYGIHFILMGVTVTLSEAKGLLTQAVDSSAFKPQNDRLTRVIHLKSTALGVRPCPTVNLRQLLDM